MLAVLYSDTHLCDSFASYCTASAPIFCLCRSRDVFNDLDSRALSSEEQNIVDRRVELQRTLTDLYEKNERKRKVVLIPC